MADSLFSPYWYRVANLHPQLAGTTTVSRQVFRGEQWYVLSNQASGRQFRVNSLGYQLVGRLDGQRTVQAIWDSLVRVLGNDAPSQHEVLRVLSELAAAGMLRSESSPDLAGIFEASRNRQSKGGSKLNPLAFRLPLWNPAPLLDAITPLGRPIFTRLTLLLWLVLMAAAFLVAQIHWNELTAYASIHLASPSNLMLMWLTYPAVKILHELSHALAVRHWQGDVHELGITFFLVMPVPYVDASAASSFPERSRRVIVSAMGVVSELTIAALALFLWLHLNDGLLREICFACMVIGGVSTVLANANPLMRFDGYYILTDLLEMPGLAARADAWLRYLGERYLLGNHALPHPPGCERSHLLLFSYGSASLLYRLVLMGSLAVWLSGKQLLLGALLTGWLLLQYLITPLHKLIRLVFVSNRLHARRGRAMLGLGFGALIIITVLGFVPAPYLTQAQGVVWVPDEARLRNDEEGFVARVLVENGALVSAGTALLELENQDLRARYQQTLTRLASREQTYQGVLLGQPGAAVALAEEINGLRSERARLEQRLANLTLRTPVNGVVGMPAASDLNGRFFARGNVLANVINPHNMTVRAVLPQEDIDLLDIPGSKIEIRVAEQPGLSLQARRIESPPAAGYQLPSPLLGDRAGGTFLTDPADADGLRTLEPIFTADFHVKDLALPRMGERAWIQIQHPAQPLLKQWWRSLHQALQHIIDSGHRGD